MMKVFLQVIVLIVAVNGCKARKSSSATKFNLENEMNQKTGEYNAPQNVDPDSLRTIEKPESDQICNESARIGQLCDDGTLFKQPTRLTSNAIVYCISLPQGELTYSCMELLVGKVITKLRLESCSPSLEFYDLLDCIEKLAATSVENEAETQP